MNVSVTLSTVRGVVMYTCRCVVGEMLLKLAGTLQGISPGKKFRYNNIIMF